MKRLIGWILLLTALSGCAQLLGTNEESRRASLWMQAQHSLWEGNFPAALEGFTYLRDRFPDSVEGRESLFYLGAIYMDPRNEGWNSRPAEQHLTEYLDLLADSGPRLYRYPEAQTLHELARQLNLPADSRVAALQPGERVIRIEERVVVPGSENRELTAEVASLKEQLAEMEALNQQQMEELERIRRTLTAPSR